MKSYFFLSILCLLFENQAVLSQSSYPTPSFALSREAASQLFGGGSKGILNCTTLLNKDWAYPNGQVVPFCNEAETSCLRYGLIAEKLTNATGNTLERVKRQQSLAWDDVSLKLRGCQLALEASLSNANFLPGTTGFSPSPLNRNHTRPNY